MRSSINLFRLAGINVGIHFSWLIIAAVLTITLATGVFRQYGWSTWQEWVAGIMGALLIFTSILIHEMAHALMAKRHGIEVKGITLFMLGGVSNLARESENAGEEFSIAIVGPLTSGVIGGACLLGSLATINGTFWDVLLFQIGIVNIVVAVFNLLPGMPLDGGRVLRAIIWDATSDVKRATSIAGTAGQLIGWAIVAAGAIIAIWRGDVFSGLWLAFIGWFLISSAGAVKRDQETRQALAGVLVSRVMDGNIRRVEKSITVKQLMEDVFIKESIRAAIVCDGEKMIGIVSLIDTRKLKHEEWETGTIEQIMTRDVETVKPNSELIDAFRIMVERDVHQVPVCSPEGKLEGMVDRMRVMSYLRAVQEMSAR